MADPTSDRAAATTSEQAATADRAEPTSGAGRPISDDADDGAEWSAAGQSAADPAMRAAARTAALIAIPVALVIGLLSLWRFGAFDGPPAPPSTTPAALAPSAPVAMPARQLADAPAAVCRSVVAHLPGSLRDSARRAVTAGPEQNAAYGEPPVTLACGVPQATYAPDAVLFPLSGVCFTLGPAAGGTVWTTVDRTIPVAVTVPGPQDGAGQSVIPFSAAISANDPPLLAPPAACR